MRRDGRSRAKHPAGGLVGRARAVVLALGLAGSHGAGSLGGAGGQSVGAIRTIQKTDA